MTIETSKHSKMSLIEQSKQHLLDHDY